MISAMARHRKLKQGGSRAPAKARHPKSTRSSKKGRPLSCPIVGVGGSAGGFEAAMELLRHLPPKNGMAFVIVQHLDPHHASRLAGLLGNVTDMPVTEITGKTIPQENTVYVQPPSKCVIVKNGALTLIRRTEKLNLAIDHFFESLAEERGARAIGVLLSGTGSDGTAGLRAIKAAGGITFAQDASAKFDAMPRSAIRSGFVDVVLPPREIAREIRRIADHPYLRRPLSDEAEMERLNYQAADDLGRIFLSLKKQMGVDFSAYKETTLNRRIQRRMALHRIEKLGQYARFLRENKNEIEALFDDLLINVTRFFRDERVFRALKRRFLPALVKSKGKDRTAQLRVWVPGCATGEEVYSFAISILETLGQRVSKMAIQIFGTDLSDSTIEHARAGIYSSAIEKDVSGTRLKRFFNKRDGMYQIKRGVREICTFARQNIAADPPFSRLDLISCRNVLIYLGAQLHKQCIPQFHYALNPGGYLILGPAESVGSFDELFELVDKRNKIYAKKNVAAPHHVDLVSYRGFELRHPDARALASDGTTTTQLQQIADRIMLSAYAPAAVVIDREIRVQQFRGRTDLFLEHTPGPATLNLLQLVRPTMVADLRSTIHRALKTERPARKERTLVKYGGKTREVNIEVVPFKVPASDKSWLLVIFDETTKGTRPGKLPQTLGKTARQREIAELRRELAASKESLQAIIEEQDSTNRNLEMMQINSDLNNLLASIQLPIVMVDNTLTVRRATPAARQAFNILQTDIGRQLHELRSNIDVPDLEDILREVIQTVSTRERRIIDKDAHEYSLRVRPYRTSDNRIDGAVITLVDIDGKKRRRRSKGKA